MKKRINVQFLIVVSIAIIVTAAAAICIFYNTFKREIMENLKTSYLEIKTLRGDTKEEAQELVNRRYKIKYELDSLLRESKHLEDFLNKYNEMFK